MAWMTMVTYSDVDRDDELFATVKMKIKNKSTINVYLPGMHPQHLPSTGTAVNPCKYQYAVTVL